VRFDVLLTGLIPALVCACPKPEPGFPSTFLFNAFFFFVVAVRSVDIYGIYFA